MKHLDKLQQDISAVVILYQDLMKYLGDLDEYLIPKPEDAAKPDYYNDYEECVIDAEMHPFFSLIITELLEIYRQQQTEEDKFND